MSTIGLGEEESVEACIEALDETATMLSHHPPRALAAALAVHLQAVLGVLHGQGECSAVEIRQWFEEIVCGTFGDDA